MKIAVGSSNPVKVNAARAAFSKYYEDILVESRPVRSNVSNMPSSNEETIRGAINRAKAALSVGFDYAVGLEGGVEDTEYGMMLFGWVAIVDRTGNIGLGNAGQFLLPEVIARRIRDGEELGPVMDDFTNSSDVKKKGGAIGYFTKDRLSRTRSFETGILHALTRFIRPEAYDG